MSRTLFIDGRKLGDGGIGTFIKYLIEGMLDCSVEFGQDFRLLIICSSHYASSHSDHIQSLKNSGAVIIIDNCPKYSLKELFLLPFRYMKEIKQAEWYISPHYVLPFFITTRKAVVVHDVIHLEYSRNWFKKIISRILIKSAIKRSNKVFTVSLYSERKIKESFPQYKNKDISIIPNASVMKPGADEIKTVFPETPRLLWIGSDRSHKRLGFFIDFLHALKKSSIDFQADIVTSPELSTLEAVKEYKLMRQISFHSNISETQIEDLYKQSDCFVGTSIEEGFCIPILDAMRSKVPLLCPDLPYVRELALEYAWYYDPLRVDAASDIFKELVIKSGERTAKCLQAFEHSLSYTPHSMGNKLLSCLGYEKKK